jgi:hypothetical protein
VPLNATERRRLRRTAAAEETARQHGAAVDVACVDVEKEEHRTLSQEEDDLLRHFRKEVREGEKCLVPGSFIPVSVLDFVMEEVLLRARALFPDSSFLARIKLQSGNAQRKSKWNEKEEFLVRPLYHSMHFILLTLVPRTLKRREPPSNRVYARITREHSEDACWHPYQDGGVLRSVWMG